MAFLLQRGSQVGTLAGECYVHVLRVYLSSRRTPHSRALIRLNRLNPVWLFCFPLLPSGLSSPPCSLRRDINGPESEASGTVRVKKRRFSYTVAPS